MLLKQLKEEFCHVNLDICGSQEKSFLVCQPCRPQMSYTLQVGDECIVAPLSLFHTELLGVTGSARTVVVQKPAALQSDAEDCFDAEYLRETGVSVRFFHKYTKPYVVICVCNVCVCV